VPGVSALNVDRVLQSEAFGLVSPFSPQTQAKIDRYDSLARKPKKTKGEEHEYQLLLDFMQGAQPFTPAPPPDSLDARVERFLAQQLQ
jgi:hypothetical protein